MSLQFDTLESTAQRLEKYLSYNYGYGITVFENYEEIGRKIGRTRNAVRYAVKKLENVGKLVFVGKRIMLVKKDEAV